jgi:hypothetical protein
MIGLRQCYFFLGRQKAEGRRAEGRRANVKRQRAEELRPSTIVIPAGEPGSPSVGLGLPTNNAWRSRIYYPKTITLFTLIITSKVVIVTVSGMTAVENLCRLPFAVCRFTLAVSLLRSAFCVLPSAFCVLPSAFCVLPSAFCVLPLQIPFFTTL